MAEIEDNEEKIQTYLKKLSDTIHRSPLFTSDKKKWKQECNRLIRTTIDYIRVSEELISDLPANSVGHYVASVKRAKKQLDQCKQEFRTKGKQQTVGDAEVGGDNSERMMVIQRGDDTQTRTHQAINSMFGVVEQGISLADETNLQLNKQIEQLDRIHSKVKDTSSSLKRAQKSINYFMRALECDKCMLALILLIVLAMIALIVLLVKKG